MLQQLGSLQYKSIRRNILLTLHSKNLQQLQRKSKKLHKLIPSKESNRKKDSNTVSVIILSSEDLDMKPLNYG